MSRLKVVTRESQRAEQEAKLERMLLEGLDSGFAPWTKDDVEEIKRCGFLRIRENGRSEERPRPHQTVNEKDN